MRGIFVYESRAVEQAVRLFCCLNITGDQRILLNEKYGHDAYHPLHEDGKMIYGSNKNILSDNRVQKFL
jgi:hypothetical protein